MSDCTLCAALVRAVSDRSACCLAVAPETLRAYLAAHGWTKGRCFVGEHDLRVGHQLDELTDLLDREWRLARPAEVRAGRPEGSTRRAIGDDESLTLQLFG